MNVHARRWSTLGVTMLGACLAGMSLGVAPAAAAVDYEGQAQGLGVHGVTVTLFVDGIAVEINRGDGEPEVLRIPETTVTFPDAVTPTVTNPPGQQDTSPGVSIPAILSVDSVGASSSVSSATLTSTATV